MKADLKELLAQLKQPELRALVESLYGTDKEVDNLIEVAVLASDTQALAKHLKKRVQSLKRGSRFISYHESFSFSATLDQLIEQIEMLLPEDPRVAFELADLFMTSHGKVYDRCDDSGGCVGDAYRDAMQLWLQAAAAWQAGSQPCKLDWADEVRKRYSDNSYAVWDFLIAGSLPLLGESKLHDLAMHFEKEVKRLGKNKSDGYSSVLANAKSGLRGVAVALGDVAMYERSYLINTPEPGDLIKEDIAKFCLSRDDAESALKWLAGEWHLRFKDRQQKLTDIAYSMSGRTDDLLKLRRDAYHNEPGFQRLQALLEVVPEAEKEALQAQAQSRASASEDIIVAVDTLIKLEALDAAGAYVLQHPELIKQVTYHALAEWAVLFEEGSEHLAAVLLYRELMLEILQAGRTKAYRHAAKYYKALERLDQHLDDYQSLVSQADFYLALQECHGRKRSFWSLLS